MERRMSRWRSVDLLVGPLPPESTAVVADAAAPRPMSTPVMPMRESTSSSDAVLLIASVGRFPSAAVCSKSCSNASSVVTTSWAGGRSSLRLFQHCSTRLERQWYSAGKILVRLMGGRAPLAAAKKASNGVK
eukprot:151184-Prymnesium_polylepis.1